MFGKQKEDKYILSKDAAEMEVEKIFDYYDIDIDEIEDKEQKKIIKMNYERLIKSIRMGRVEVKIEGGLKVIHHLKDESETLTYSAPNAEAKMAMAGCDPNDNYGKIYNLMGSCSKMGLGAIKKLPANELPIVEVLGAIFLSA
jgi:plasmid stabilization system protein ParE